MMKFSIFLLAGLFASVLVFAAVGDSPPPSAAMLRSELTKIRAEIESAQKGVDDAMKRLRERQRRIEYEDPEIVAVREELLELERQVLRKREELNAKLALVPEIKRIEEERRDYFHRLRQLRETEAAIQRELAARERE